MLNWEMIGVMSALLMNMGVCVWWASRITAKLDTNRETLIRVERDMEKRDTQLAAAWKKIDGHEHRITVIETKCKIHLTGEEA